MSNQLQVGYKPPRQRLGTSYNPTQADKPTQSVATDLGFFRHRENQLKVGTACTAFFYDDYEPGAFDANDHVARVIKEDRKDMTSESVYSSINWSHIWDVTDHHYVRVILEFVPHLNHLSAQLSARFRKAPIALLRLRADRKTIVQALPTNAEREVENKGMQHAIHNFDTSSGDLSILTNVPAISKS
ncbi:hypothetical protein B0H13DRAFT_1921451 [Mycena leptocephala]|nr:hypothetical protein B0H13DRAFT_1921451 [Mycena leptocephala]